MKNIVASLGAALLLASSIGAPAGAQTTYPTDPPREILMIGNSFTRGVNRLLTRLMRDRGHDVRIKARAPNGATLGVHTLKPGTYRKIASRPWDIVVLQEQSLGMYEPRYPDARELDAAIRANGSTTMFFMTWRQEGDAPAAYDNLRGVPGGPVGYVPIAFELGAPLAPVGWAFRTAVAANPDERLWSDGRHANARGRYLAAAVFYATILRESPASLTWHPRHLDPDDAAALRQLAADVVLSDLPGWNVSAP